MPLLQDAVQPGSRNGQGGQGSCPHCHAGFTILDAVSRTGTRPDFRLYGKLVLTRGEAKEYLPPPPRITRPTGPARSA